MKITEIMGITKFTGFTAYGWDIELKEITRFIRFIQFI